MAGSPDGSEFFEAARDGDQDAFAELTRPYRTELHAHLYRMLGSTHDADDALQDTLLRAWRGLAGFESRSSLRTWLFRIATNVALTASARRARRVLPLDLSDSAERYTHPAPVEGQPSPRCNCFCRTNVPCC